MRKADHNHCQKYVHQHARRYQMYSHKKYLRKYISPTKHPKNLPQSKSSRSTHRQNTSAKDKVPSKALQVMVTVTFTDMDRHRFSREVNVGVEGHTAMVALIQKCSLSWTHLSDLIVSPSFFCVHSSRNLVACLFLMALCGTYPHSLSPWQSK